MRSFRTAILLSSFLLIPLKLGAQGNPDNRSESDRARLVIQWRHVRDADVVRGLWVTRWEYHTPEDITALLSRSASFGITDVFFQVRGRGDAFYRSKLEPWGIELTGVLGLDPGWDPLEVAIREAHSRGLRLHAWVNTFTMWSGDYPPPHSQPEHIFNSHPEWIMVNRTGLSLRLGNRFGYVLAAPGNREVQEHIKAVVMDIIDNYHVDGVHFDYIRLPDHDYSYDAVSRGRFLRESVSGSYMDWQAGEITAMLQRISEEARTRRPGLILTAATVNHYHRAVGIFAQDPARWVESGALDYVIPMMYTSFLPEFVEMLNGYKEMLSSERIVAGINLGEMPDDPGTVAAQVHESLLSGVRGHALFSLDDVDRFGRSGAEYTDLYTYMEELQGARFLAAQRAEVELRTEEATPTFEPSGGQEIPARSPSTHDSPSLTRKSIWKYLIPAAAGAALLIVFVIL